MRQVVGIHSVREAFKVRPHAIKKIILKKDYAFSRELKDFYEESLRLKVPVKTTSVQELNRYSHGHQGVMVEVDEDPQFPWEKLKGEAPALILALDGVLDPQNLGSILRTSWLLGVSGILITESKSVGLTATVCKVASGGAEHVPIESSNQLFPHLKQLKEMGFWVYGLSEKSEESIWKHDFHHKTVLVAGAEEHGMRPQTLKECDALIKIPQKEDASLNVSISLAIGISEFSRKHLL